MKYDSDLLLLFFVILSRIKILIIVPIYICMISLFLQKLVSSSRSVNNLTNRIGCYGFTEAETPPGQHLFLSLPKEEREDFLTYCLGNVIFQNTTSPFTRDNNFTPEDLGIDKNLIQKFQNLTVPENFTNNLYTFVKSQYNMDQHSLRSLILQRMVCLSNGTCVDMSDVGSMCCPF
ncbi:GSCOCG00001101001-RA-CDS [Cotesia congregata]|uniref:Uncharacterized protein n=1 Tax=Cotesia congregata TaxID=51543 RepID=A0A8J2MJU2_COTCN|nr:GSCOCG00001101001-RA-CDS [Cotesia congregata]CAG5096137.1 Protein of unknown function [Cotesia congregata]